MTAGSDTASDVRLSSIWLTFTISIEPPARLFVTVGISTVKTSDHKLLISHDAKTILGVTFDYKDLLHS